MTAEIIWLNPLHTDERFRQRKYGPVDEALVRRVLRELADPRPPRNSEGYGGYARPYADTEGKCGSGWHYANAIAGNLKLPELAVTLAYRILAERGLVEVERCSMTAHVHCLPWLLRSRVLAYPQAGSIKPVHTNHSNYYTSGHC